MLKGEKVILRPMKPEDILRQHEFEQDVELFGLEITFLSLIYQGWLIDLW